MKTNRLELFLNCFGFDFQIAINSKTIPLELILTSLDYQRVTKFD